MYSLGKSALSKFVSGGCQRRLRLDLYAGAAARRAADAVDKDDRRPGGSFLKEQGRRYERACFQDLIKVFGTRVVRGDFLAEIEGGLAALTEIELAGVIDRLTAGSIVLEASYPVPQEFAQDHGLDTISDVPMKLGVNRPDIIAVVDIAKAKTGMEIVTSTGDLVPALAGDRRLGLKIIDIKLSSDATPSHFAELAYYAMTLACWLQVSGFDDRFAVVADAAIWPGNQDGSHLKKFQYEIEGGYTVPKIEDYWEAWHRDLVVLPAGAMLGRLKRVLHHDLAEVIGEPDWQTLPIHIGSRCQGCDYLGYDWFQEEGNPKDQRYCWPTAERLSNLSRIPGLSEGAAGTLNVYGVSTVEQFAALPGDSPAFERHQALKTSKHVLQARARALTQKEHIGLPDVTGSSAALPRFSDIRVALSVDADNATGNAFALGYEIVASIPIAKGEVNPEWKGTYKRTAERAGQVFLVRSREEGFEARLFADFLEKLRGDIQAFTATIQKRYREFGAEDRKPTIQFYVWNRAMFDQLRRLMGRHLVSLQKMSDVMDYDMPAMTWIFPPDTVLKDATQVGSESAITVVSDAVKLLALNLPHHYGQMAVANAYRHVRPGANREPYEYRLSYAFSDPLSDQMPAERGHELWNGVVSGSAKTFDEFTDRLEKAVRHRLLATLSVARKLAHDLNDGLTAYAPTVESVFSSGRRLFKVSNDLQVIYQHQRLMNAAAAMDINMSMAMAPFEREARFGSARVRGVVSGIDRRNFLEGAGLFQLVGDRQTFVFSINPGSRDAKIKAGDFNFSLMPEGRLLDRMVSMAKLRDAHPDLNIKAPLSEQEKDRQYRITLREACGVAVLAFDRRNLRIAVRVSEVAIALVELGVFDFAFTDDHMGIMDPLHIDFFGPKLKETVEAVMTPPKSVSRQLVKTNISKVPMARTNVTASVPLEDFIWDADRLCKAPSGRSLSMAQTGIKALGKQINPKQALAIQQAVERRLSLLWGPPGTGKSATSLSLLMGLVSEATAKGKAIRIAITGPTWVAIDNVMAEVPAALEKIGHTGATLVRLLSPSASANEVPEELRPHVMTTAANADRLDEVCGALTSAGRVTIVAGTASQIFKLGKLVEGPVSSMFDFMLIDEASQMDVATALLAFTTLAPGASVTVVGDDKQMSPIHPIEAPDGLGHLVGSIYDFYARYREHQGDQFAVPPTMLEVNFRSNAEIVAFFQAAGYEKLSSARAAMRMTLVGERPPVWPHDLSVSPAYPFIVSPSRPLVAIVHDDRFSSQRNELEADLVAALVAMVRGRMADLESGTRVLDDRDLFRTGIGIVTPHRAQQSAVVDAISRRMDLSDAALEAMYGSVDTVERFQGQQRIMMIASFGMGDKDQIAGEEDFLYNLNRFNVIASRAQAKMIVIMSRRMANHLPRDVETLRGSQLLKSYVDGSVLQVHRTANLPGVGQSELYFSGD